jgi:hypothetical protein
MASGDAIERMGREFGIPDTAKAQDEGDIVILTAKDAYFPDGRVDNDRIIRQWQTIAENAVKRGRRASGYLATWRDSLIAAWRMS